MAAKSEQSKALTADELNEINREKRFHGVFLLTGDTGPPHYRVLHQHADLETLTR
jgi:hypothetical protein